MIWELNFKRKARQIVIGKKTLLMGIVNTTPDSFSDGGKYYKKDKALLHCLKLIEEGADILDIGGESTRPNALPVKLEEELERTIPLIQELRKRSNIFISIDTTKSQVARHALEEGVDIINDVSGFHNDKNMLSLIKKFDCLAIAMHRRGTPQTMQNKENLIYNNLIGEINSYFSVIIKQAESLGISKGHIILDVGLGFSKNLEQNIQIIQSLSEFHRHKAPLLLGPSKKSFIGAILGEENPPKRVWGTGAIVAYAIIQKVSVLRVHNIKEMKDICLILDKICNRL